MLRAIGATRAQVIQMILIESLLQAWSVRCLDSCSAYLMASALASGINTFLLQYMPGVHLEIVIPSWRADRPAFLGIVTTLIAGYLPARSASRISRWKACARPPNRIADVWRDGPDRGRCPDDHRGAAAGGQY